MNDNMSEELAWVPQQCTLPTVDRPLRVAEFDRLFATALRGVNRPKATRLRLLLDSDVEPMARDLAERESSCCSFFTFAFAPASGGLMLDVEVPAAKVDVLDALAARAESLRLATG